MSGHLIGCAGALQHLPIDEHLPEDQRRTIPTSHKLALLAFADSADDRTHIGFAGYEGVQKWATCSRGRAAELIRDLVSWGLLRQHKRGRRGQRAEYVVFPGGCCEIHRTPDEEPAVDLQQLADAAGVSIDQARRMLAAMGTSDPVPAGDVQPADSGASEPENGSDAPDAISGPASDAPDPNSRDVQQSTTKPVDNPGKGPDSVHDPRSTANAFTPSERSTPYPAGTPAGSCAAHPNGHANCRDCGTSPRARREAAKRAAAAAARAAAKAALKQERAAAAAKRATDYDVAAGMARLRDAQARIHRSKEQVR